jgi:hypothetical protein
MNMQTSKKILFNYLCCTITDSREAFVNLFAFTVEADFEYKKKFKPENEVSYFKRKITYGIQISRQEVLIAFVCGIYFGSSKQDESFVFSSCTFVDLAHCGVFHYLCLNFKLLSR